MEKKSRKPIEISVIVNCDSVGNGNIGINYADRDTSFPRIIPNVNEAHVAPTPPPCATNNSMLLPQSCHIALHDISEFSHGTKPTTPTQKASKLEEDCSLIFSL